MSNASDKDDMTDDYSEEIRRLKFCELSRPLPRKKNMVLLQRRGEVWFHKGDVTKEIRTSDVNQS
jgi:hypothetical protein